MDTAARMEIDEMLQKGYKSLGRGEDIQEILDWLDERYYSRLDAQQKKDYQQLYDLANVL